MPMDLLFKSTLILGLAGAAAAVLRNSSASVRHAIWALAVAGALAVGPLSLLLPAWHLPVIPSVDRGGPVAAAIPAAGLTVAPAPASEARPAPVAPQAEAPARRAPVKTREGGSATTARPAEVALQWSAVFTGLWLSGALVLLLRIFATTIAAGRLARTRTAGRAPWLGLARRLAGVMGVPRTRFVRSDRVGIPMAVGCLRPAILLPAEADAWPPARLTSVLLHELAHVRRRDCLTQLLSSCACAVYWINPAMWMAARALKRERERACDDRVLSAGTPGPDYAEHLLEVARAARGSRTPLFAGGVAMAHRSELEGRLMAILDDARSRGSLSLGLLATTTILCLALVTPIAALDPWASNENVVDRDSRTATAAVEDAGHDLPARAETAWMALQRADERGALESMPGAPAGGVAPGAAGGRRVGTEVGVRGGVEGLAVSRAIGSAAGSAVVTTVVSEPRDPVGETVVLAQGLPNPTPTPSPNPTPTPTPNPTPQPTPVVAGRQRARAPADPKVVAALSEALKDTDAEVRQQALHSLAQLRDPASFDAFVLALGDKEAEVRQQAAHALGQLRDARAVKALTGALADSDAEVRQQAVYALGQLRDPSAVDALATALRDGDAEVRQQAAYALGQIRDARSVAPLVSALQDKDEDVRGQAAYALGEIRDPKAVDGLLGALKDSATEVRRQALYALAQLRDSRAKDAALVALKDSDPEVRRMAAHLLGELIDKN